MEGEVFMPYCSALIAFLILSAKVGVICGSVKPIDTKVMGWNHEGDQDPGFSVRLPSLSLNLTEVPGRAMVMFRWSSMLAVCQILESTLGKIKGESFASKLSRNAQGM